MELVDVFNQDAFSMASMSKAIELAPGVSRDIKDSNLFVAKPERTDVIGVEYREGQIQIASVDERGDVIESAEGEERVIRYIKTKRVARKDRIRATDLAFVREMGNDQSRVVGEVTKEIARRQTGPMGLMAQCENTKELMRLGALQGKVIDRDGRLLWNFYDLFEIPEPPVLAFALSTLTEGALRKEVESKVVRPMKRMAKGLHFTGVEAWCGEEFWDGLMSNPEFYKTFETQQAGAELREGTLGSVVKFAGVTWREYAGASDGTSINIQPDQVQFNPSGESGMFLECMSPGESFADLGTLGQEWYSYQVMDPEGLQRFVDLYVLSYPGMFNTRPDLVFKGRVSS